MVPPPTLFVDTFIGLISSTVAGQQYCSVAKILLSLSEPLPLAPSFGVIGRGLILPFVRDEALKVCGLAYTNEDVSARVNAFGPLAFCAYAVAVLLDKSLTKFQAVNTSPTKLIETAW
jgi:hypothetical protein